jgi:hypothetical protein
MVNINIGSVGKTDVDAIGDRSSEIKAFEMSSEEWAEDVLVYSEESKADI